MLDQFAMTTDIGGSHQPPLRHCLQRFERGHKIGEPHRLARISEDIDLCIIILDLIMGDAPDEDDMVGKR